ncbi:toll/interleukin-1 receptor domain-containing protein [Aquimarina longa]|uniref:toll/interleukin-1 receptor domain-containing protein n=1 Tax=Aquimarina longa TaxID=1080221 RepID=UPI000782E590|nr:toll/interleukin-1 receptor domain-containing protein [Aquimarina longa]
MNILSKYGLLQFRNNARIYNKSVIKSLQLFKEETKLLKTLLFLSYKYDELEELDSAINFLKGFRILIHVDYILEEITSEDKMVTKRIQEQIEDKIKKSRKFIFIATENAISSKHCKWQIRYANTQKSIDHIAILPIREDYADYSGKEYLQKYPYIQKNEMNPIVYEVKFPNGDIIELGDWLAL